ncbi:MAG: hypothetical protein ISS71_00585 [Phycisphaerae bacterium]|nr:hypothetical protein [Phycisphaerae bacterium]
MKQRLILLWMFLLIFAWVQAQRSDITVGVYYYTWHGPDVGGHDFTTTLRDHLVPAQQPKMGHYNNNDPAVIESHIRQSLRGNIHFWACSWWGPDSFEDKVLRNAILPHPSASNLRYAILYESTGRLGSPDNPNYDKLQTDFAYLKEHYFNHPFYFKIDGRPVVFIYLTRVYFRNRGEQALTDLRANFPKVYIVADDIFGRGYKPTDAAKWDAVTAYDVYGQTLSPYGSTHKSLSQLELILQDARTVAKSVSVGLIPFASPGFNDGGVRSGHDAAPRYFVDKPEPVEGDLFRGMLRDAVVPAVDPLADNILMVTSFNEWHEDTQIEPTAGTILTTSRDDSDGAMNYTQGYLYADYGNLYLDILREETLMAVTDPNDT